LEISAVFEDVAAATGKLVDTWLTYTRLARVFLNNIEVTTVLSVLFFFLVYRRCV
jgi:hypothetical protein